MTTSSFTTSLDEEQLLTVLTALKDGDFTRRMPTGGTGTAGKIAETLNALLDQLHGMEAETRRITHEMGTEGRFGGQADVPGLSGSWKEMVDNVNSMAGNLTNQVRRVAQTITAIAEGDLGKWLDIEVNGEMLELKTTINRMVDQFNSFAREVTCLGREVGNEGKLGIRAEVPGIAGSWKDLLDNINFMVAKLTEQVRDLSAVTCAVARGDLSRRITVNVRGELLELKTVINGMIDQLDVFASECNRITQGIVEGKFGGQAEIPVVDGCWQDFITNLNRMSATLTVQVRDLSRTVHALVAGETARRVTVPAGGETAELKEAINRLGEQLSRPR